MSLSENQFLLFRDMRYPALWARTGTSMAPIGAISACMTSPGLTGLTPSGVPVYSTSPG